MFGMELRIKGPTLLIILCAMIFLSPSIAPAQTYTILHHFSGAEGANPADGLSIDHAGRLYGVTFNGGFQQGSCSPNGCGTVFRMTPAGSGWLFSPLYKFANVPDGAHPYGRVILGPDGALYGTTQYGGNGNGTVFRLAPPPTAPKNALAPWNASILHAFGGPGDGYDLIDAGGLVFDGAGKLYGTSYFGGPDSGGIVFELTPSNGGWTESILYGFRNDGIDGENPSAGVIVDHAGNVYGATNLNGCRASCAGTVFQLTLSASGWTENILYSFDSDGAAGEEPEGGLIMDSAGNLYGSTVGGFYGATVFELTPSNGTWTLSVLAYVAGGLGFGPSSSLLLDEAGNLYGTTYSGGAFGDGNVFKLTRSGGTWTLSTLHDFHGGDGRNPRCNLIMDANGNLYGTTYAGGRNNLGVVFEITP